MACSSGCPTPGAHRSWGECVKAKGIRTDEVPHDIMTAFRAEQNAYADARRQGVQPETTRMMDIKTAMYQAGAL